MATIAGLLLGYRPNPSRYYIARDLMSTSSFSHQPPAYPARRPEVLAAVQQQLQSAFTRLEGALELEQTLQSFHGPDSKGRDPWSGISAQALLVSKPSCWATALAQAMRSSPPH